MVHLASTPVYKSESNDPSLAIYFKTLHPSDIKKTRTGTATLTDWRTASGQAFNISTGVYTVENDGDYNVEASFSPRGRININNGVASSFNLVNNDTVLYSINFSGKIDSGKYTINYAGPLHAGDKLMLQIVSSDSDLSKIGKELYNDDTTFILNTI